VEYGHQLNISSGTKENHGKPWSSWSVAGLSGCSQQSSIKHASPNISPHLRCCFLSFFLSLKTCHRSRSYFTTDGQSVSQSVSMSWCRAHFGTCDQILFLVVRFLSKNCSLVSVWHPLWWEDRAAVYSAITQWSELRKTLNRTLLPHLRLPQTGEPTSHIFILQKQSGPIIAPGTGFPLRRLLRLAGLRWTRIGMACALDMVLLK
jgi:hypothetical protein